MELDIKKISPTPKDKWEAIELMVKAHGQLTDAYNIMTSALQYNTEEYKEINERRMRGFVTQFEKL